MHDCLKDSSSDFTRIQINQHYSKPLHLEVDNVLPGSCKAGHICPGLIHLSRKPDVVSAERGAVYTYSQRVFFP
jgi:hypothetical protein